LSGRRIEILRQANAQHLRQPVIEAGRVAQHFHVARLQQTKLLRLVQRTDRRRIEDAGRVRGMHKLQELHHEFDIDQPARDVFQVPAVAIALLFGDRLAHLNDVAGNQRAVAPARQRLADRFVDPRGERRRARHDARARERKLLPRPRIVLLVILEARQRCRHRSRPA
jgi:hypothetical protein